MKKWISLLIISWSSASLAKPSTRCSLKMEQLVEEFVKEGRLSEAYKEHQKIWDRYSYQACKLLAYPRKIEECEIEVTQFILRERQRVFKKYKDTSISCIEKDFILYSDAYDKAQNEINRRFFAKTQKKELISSRAEYAVGDCLMITDMSNGRIETPYRVRIEKIEADFYWYRWLLDNNQWAIDLSCLKRGAGPCWDFEALEKISKKVSDCPGGE